MENRRNLVSFFCLVLLFITGNAFSQIQIVTADIQQWKQNTYSIWRPGPDTTTIIKDFSINVANSASWDVSTYSLHDTSTENLNSWYQISAAAYPPYKLILGSSFPFTSISGFPGATFKSGHKDVNCYGTVNLPGGSNVQVLGVRSIIVLYYAQIQLTEVLYTFELVSKEYGVVAQWNTSLQDDTTLLMPGKSYSKSQIFTSFAQSYQSLYVIKFPVQSGIKINYNNNSIRKVDKVCFALEPTKGVAYFDLLGRSNLGGEFEKKKSCQLYVFRNMKINDVH